eukprot:1598095-Pyramimonas_sp.AAC.1
MAPSRKVLHCSCHRAGHGGLDFDAAPGWAADAQCDVFTMSSCICNFGAPLLRFERVHKGERSIRRCHPASGSGTTRLGLQSAMSNATGITLDVMSVLRVNR